MANIVNISECCFSTGEENTLHKVIWKLTNQCYGKCNYCSENKDQKESWQDFLQKNISILNKLHTLGIHKLVLTGGEPLLLKSNLIDLVDQACKLGMSFSLSTTGAPKDIFLKILERKPRKINLSLDATNPEVNEKGRGPGSYQSTLEALELLKERNIRTHITTVLTRFNYRHVKSILKFVKENSDNITGLSVQNQYPIGKGEICFPLIYDELLRVYQDLKGNLLEKIPDEKKIDLVNAPDMHYPLQKCPAGQTLFTIFPDGTYTSCLYLLNVSKTFALGNMLDDNLESIRNRLKESATLIGSGLKEMSASTPTCSECPQRSACGLGCYVLKVVHESIYKKPTLRCKRFVENQRQLRNELSVEEESQIRKVVKEALERSDIAHKFDHVENVVALAKMIGIDEGANLRIVVPAAYFHDIVPRKNLDCMREHVKESYEKAIEYLKKNINFTSIEVDDVTDTIRCSAWESHLEGVEPETLEAKVLRDADWLDAMGARGIARVFGFAGFCKLDMGDIEYDPEAPVKLECKPQGPDPTPFYHFFSKLLWLKDNMLTERGKAEAITRHNFMVSFLKVYKSETQYIKEL